MSKTILPKSAVTSTRQSFYDFFHKGVSLPVLKDGKHRGTINSISWVQPNTLNGNPYVRVELILEDGRLIVDNRFAKGFEIFINQAKTQLGLSEVEVNVPEFIKSLIGTELDVWTVHVTVNNEVYRNIHYAEIENDTAKDDEDF